tara:strand:+ start:1188 stop:1973 length:786 start_codon:yes stop_codon:yes gene_type:complete
MIELSEKIASQLIQDGYFKFNLLSQNFKKANSILISIVKKQIKNKFINLEKIHKNISIEELNNLRLHIFNKLNNNEDFKNSIFSSAEKFIVETVGNELACSDMNLSIQLPGDNSSLLDMHSDFFSGESIFQINLWIPFVSVKKTQSMFIINPLDSLIILKKIKKNKIIDFKKILQKYKKKMKWINLKKGEAILFSANCLHGNIVNEEKNTRWSINVRYKNLYSPYSNLENEKKIGGFYKPLSLKAISTFNLRHNFYEIIKK